MILLYKELIKKYKSKYKIKKLIEEEKQLNELKNRHRLISVLLIL